MPLVFQGNGNARHTPPLSAVSSMYLPIAFNPQEDINLKGTVERAFLLLPPGWTTHGHLSLQILAPEPARNDNSTPSTDFNLLTGSSVSLIKVPKFKN